MYTSGLVKNLQLVPLVSTYAFYCFYFNIEGERESPGHAAAKGKNPSAAASGALMLPHDLATPFVRARMKVAVTE